MGGRVHVEADDVLDLHGESGIVGLLDGADAMGLETTYRPDALYGAKRDADDSDDHAARPMRGFSGSFAARQGDNLGDRLRREGRIAGLTSFVAQQAVYPFLGEALLPAPYRWAVGARPARHSDERRFVRGQDSDASPPDMLLRAVSIADDDGQARAVFGWKQEANGLRHAPTVTRITPAVNPPFASAQ